MSAVHPSVALAGTAHDLRSFLQVIVGASEAALLDIEHGRRPNRRLECIREAGLKAATMTTELMRASMPEEARREADALEVAGFVEAWALELRQSYPPAIAILTLDEGTEATVRMGALDLERVLLNLAWNAREAMMPLGGELRVSTRSDEDWVVIEVNDSGKGMDAKTLARAFLPGFTTKGGVGGLGLAVCGCLWNGLGGRCARRVRRGRGRGFRCFCRGAEIG